MDYAVSEPATPPPQTHVLQMAQSTPQLITQQSLPNQSNLGASQVSANMGSKRGRLLIRQQRIKKDSDQVTAADLEANPEHYSDYVQLTVPSKMERHASEPAPTTSTLINSPTITQNQNQNQNLLSVPAHSYLIKQHSNPLLPSQSHSPPINTYTLQRQLSQPTQTSSSSSLVGPQYHLVHMQKHHQSASSINTLMSQQQQQQQHHMSHMTKLENEGQVRDNRSQHSLNSPTVVIIPDLGGNNEQQQHQNVTTHSHHLQLPSLRVKTEELQRSISSPLSSSTRELSLENPRSSHCPVVRPGPALGCNFCWNTIDAHGRILRRKTKYHCPECQTNLCIVPCFQEYHERLQSENPPNENSTIINKASLKHHPKAGSM